MTRLLAFHIGPIQEFIVAARRTQDFWMGSWLLSHLSRQAIETALGNGGELVLPHKLKPGTERDPTDADTTNHFTAHLPLDNAAAIADRIEQAVRGEWVRIAEEVRQKFFGDVDERLWQRQIGGLLEIYWTLTPDDGSASARNLAWAALEARKRLRNFEPTEEVNLKCTLCGQRQEVSGKLHFGDARNWWINKVGRFGGRLRVREDGSERLCAVCAVKRAALMSGALKCAGLDKEDGHFPSTSGVAAASFKQKLLTTSSCNATLNSFFQAVDDLGLTSKVKVDEDCLSGFKQISAAIDKSAGDRLMRIDGDVFYRELFVETRFKREFPSLWENLLQQYGRELVDDARETASVGLGKLGKIVESSPSKYFAVLMMDGDHMGAFFRKASAQQAEDLSECVSAFASHQAKEIVNKHLGRLVYAGGDDLMALLPLETALTCAQGLQERFKQAVADVQPPEGVARPTPSAGIAIAHHTAPLDLTLLTMQRAEKAAKNVYGRNAVCIHLLKRSGDEIKVGSRWTTAGGEDLLPLVLESTVLLRERILSMKFVQAVSSESRILTALPLDARKSELCRLARRQKGEQFSEEMHKAQVEALMTKLAAWADEVPRSKNNLGGLEEVAQWLQVARFIAIGGRDEE